MGDNLVPNGLSEGCKVSFSRLADGAREEHPWPGHCGSARAFAVNPRAPKARALCGLRGIDRSARPSKCGVSCQECREAPSEGRPVQTAVSETWVIILGPKGLSSGCSALCSRSI